MSKLRVLALVDGSPYADDVLRMAHDLARWSGGELEVLSEVEPVMPGLMDGASKDRSKQEALEAGQRSLKERVAGLGVPDAPVHVVASGLLDAALEAMPGPGFFVVGIKGTGILRRIFIGSKVVELIERTPVPVVAVPRGMRIEPPLHLYVGVAPDEPFLPEPLRDLVRSIGGNVGRATFFSMAGGGGEGATAAAAGLRMAEAACGLQVPTEQEVVAGEAGLAALKERMVLDRRSLLVLRRGGRELVDQLFRRYFINELVYEAHVPLVVLP